MLGGRSWESWIAEYSESHQHPLNRLTHTFGIPIILLSLPLLVAGIFWRTALWVGVALFVVGWTLQLIGHAIEGKPPEFLKPGDVVEISIDGIGTLKTPIAAMSQRPAAAGGQ